jgi:hypothetical protein
MLVKSRWMRWAGHVTQIEQKESAIFGRKYQLKTTRKSWE